MPSPTLPRTSPAHPVVIFDGICNFCDHTVQFLMARDRARVLRFAASQSDAGAALLARHGLQPGEATSVYLLEGEQLYAQSEAALRIAANLPLPWRLASGLRIFPAPLRDAVYAWVARNRYRWFGQRAACRLPTPETRALFL